MHAVSQNPVGIPGSSLLIARIPLLSRGEPCPISGNTPNERQIFLTLKSTPESRGSQTFFYYRGLTL